MSTSVVDRTSSQLVSLSAVLKLVMLLVERILRVISLGLDLTLPILGERKVMKWSLRSSMIEPLISECALLLVMMWSMSVEELP